MIGATISHYHILEKLGEGGMGVVYKARDVHLDRLVALKVLPPDRTGDRERRRRFVQEAKAASALEHPNIVTIYEIVEHDGHSSIAMQYVTGKTVRELLASGPLLLIDVLRISIQLADGLACAHKRGIVHRDLKPENVMVTPEGHVKVLDFGLAKLIGGEDPDPASTLETTKTGEGHIVGTVSYMSPEQAQARPLDARSDIFSFGCVLYEMITGRRAFRGDNPLSILAAIVRDEPAAISLVAPTVPADLERVIWRALRKDPERRWQSMADVRVMLAEIKEAYDSGSGPFAVSAPGPTRPKPRFWKVTALALALAAIGGIAWMRLRQTTSTRPPELVPFTSYSGLERTPSLSPDGNQVAFSWNGEKGDNFDIYVKLVGTGAPLRLTTDPAEDEYPVWSPDGRFIAFVRDGRKAMIIPALGGAEREISEASSAGLAWSPDGKFLAVVLGGRPSAISLVSIDTAEVRRVTSPPSAFMGDTRPAFSRDGRTLAFLRHPGAVIVADIHVLGLTADGAPAGEPVRLTFDDRHISSLAWTPERDTLVFASARAGSLSLWSIAPRGRAEPERSQIAAENVQWLSLSRDRNRMVYARMMMDRNIWRAPGPTASAAGKVAPQQLIASTQADAGPQYSPDGARIAFSSTRSGHSEIWISESDGSNPRQITSFSGSDVGTPRWSPDGRRIAFDSTKDQNRNVYLVSADGGGLRRLTSDKTDEVRPSWSRDGHWIYFGSNRTGSFQIWKVPAEGGEAVQVTRGGGREGFESPDGYLYYAHAYSPRLPERRGIWRVQPGGGDEVQVLTRGRQGHWAVFKNGCILLNFEEAAIDYYAFAQTSPVRLLSLPRNAIPRSGFDGPALAVSPDGQWLLYIQQDRADSDILLVENFR